MIVKEGNWISALPKANLKYFFCAKARQTVFKIDPIEIE